MKDDELIQELLLRGLKVETPASADSEPVTPDPLALGLTRVRSQDFLEGGKALPVSDEAVMAEARRLALRGQVPQHELNELRRKLAGEPYRPTHAEVCEAAGATMTALRGRHYYRKLF